jgi:hypothetical protein
MCVVTEYYYQTFKESRAKNERSSVMSVWFDVRSSRISKNKTLTTIHSTRRMMLIKIMI